MDLAKYDDLIARILEEERDIYPFLDVIFGFLWRRTDFFTILKEKGKIGFPPGGAEKIVLSVLRKWQNLSRKDPVKSSSPKKEKSTKSSSVENFPECLPVAKEEVVCTSVNDSAVVINTTKLPEETNGEIEKKKDADVNPSEIYNGADRGTYRWSQTITDVEVLIPVPEYIKKSKEVNVSLSDCKLSVAVKDKSDPTKWNSIVNGDFCYRVKKEESVWSLSPGHHISVHCEKVEERWWDALLTCEPKLDAKKIEACRPMSELSEEEQMKVEELMWNEERKLLGLKTSEQMKAEKVLKDAWDVEGSPFKGTDFDPSVIHFDTSSVNSLGFQGNG